MINTTKTLNIYKNIEYSYKSDIKFLIINKKDFDNCLKDSENFIVKIHFHNEKNQKKLNEKSIIFSKVMFFNDFKLKNLQKSNKSKNTIRFKMNDNLFKYMNDNFKKLLEENKSRFKSGKAKEIKFKNILINKFTKDKIFHIENEKIILKNIPELYKLIKLIINKFPEYNFSLKKIFPADIMRIINLEKAKEEINNRIEIIKLNNYNINVFKQFNFQYIIFYQIKKTKSKKILVEKDITETFYKDLEKIFLNINNLKITIKETKNTKQEKFTGSYVIEGKLEDKILFKTNCRKFRKSRSDKIGMETKINSIILGKTSLKSLEILFNLNEVSNINNPNWISEIEKEDYNLIFSSLEYINKNKNENQKIKFLNLILSQYMFIKHKVIKVK